MAMDGAAQAPPAAAVDQVLIRLAGHARAALGARAAMILLRSGARALAGDAADDPDGPLARALAAACAGAAAEVPPRDGSPTIHVAPLPDSAGALATAGAAGAGGALAGFAALAADMLALARAAPQDPETGLLAADAWRDAVRAAAARALAHGRPCALLAIAPDAPSLAAGDDAGADVDALLPALAARLRAVRAADAVARIGRGRLGVLLTEVQAQGALSAARRLRLAARAGAIPVSIGLACLGAPGGVAPADAAALAEATLAEAHDALAAARWAGGDRVASSLIAPPRHGAD